MPLTAMPKDSKKSLTMHRGTGKPLQSSVGKVYYISRRLVVKAF